MLVALGHRTGARVRLSVRMIDAANAVRLEPGTAIGERGDGLLAREDVEAQVVVVAVVTRRRRGGTDVKRSTEDGEKAEDQTHAPPKRKRRAPPTIPTNRGPHA